MAFILTKVMLFLVLPPACILILLLSGLLLARRKRAAGNALITLGIVLLYVLSLPAVADRLERPLESSYPPFAGTRERIDAVVVLGGGVSDLSWVPLPPELSGMTLQRLVTGIGVAQTLKAPLVLSGGSGAIAPTSAREADAMADTAVSLGFPRDRIRIENSSRNTLENAREVAKILPHGNIILVTSAYHMGRAAAMFRKEGFTVNPAPTGYLVERRDDSWSNFLPRIGELETSSQAIAEYLSLTWYRMQNNI